MENIQKVETSIENKMIYNGEEVKAEDYQATFETLIQKQTKELPNALVELIKHGRKRNHWIWWACPLAVIGGSEFSPNSAV